MRKVFGKLEVGMVKTAYIFGYKKVDLKGGEYAKELVFAPFQRFYFIIEIVRLLNHDLINHNKNALSFSINLSIRYYPKDYFSTQSGHEEV